MKIRSKLPWIQIVAWAVTIHLVLVVLSFLEVFIYSLFHPEQPQEFYAGHAKVSGPYISIVFGFFAFILTTRHLCKKRKDKKWGIAIMLSVVYTLMDFLIVHLLGVNWLEHYFLFVVSSLFKVFGALLGAYTIKTKS